MNRKIFIISNRKNLEICKKVAEQLIDIGNFVSYDTYSLVNNRSGKEEKTKYINKMHNLISTCDDVIYIPHEDDKYNMFLLSLLSYAYEKQAIKPDGNKVQIWEIEDAEE